MIMTPSLRIVGGNAGRVVPGREVGGCYEPGFTIVKPGLGSVKIPPKRTAEGQVWLIFRV
jgi:hypothetical protein